ncbi:MAG: hypothetical protein CMG39_04400 [Candidatus Marinimicrobia bacterium]|nr:hypothetical protein [Candidatus Neomarinimicrobiota bacterium]|tara:strand:- start:5377 stop:6342 length:966 start_codon:yes stop_codon:yes gene_type:complete
MVTDKIINDFFTHSNLENFLVVDVGARNGFGWLENWYTKKSKIVGFEPNKLECEKLKKHITDASKQGIKFPKFKTYEYYDKIVWDKKGKLKFCEILNSPARSGVDLKPTKLLKKVFVDGENIETRINKHKVIIKQSICIDDFFNKKIIDYLKIDVEGGEIFVLHGSKKKLKNKEILFIKTEFMSNNFYKNSSNITNLIQFMKKFGYRLIDIDLNPYGYHRSSEKTLVNQNKDFLLGGDLNFIIDPDENFLSNEIKFRLGFVLVGAGFKQCGFELIKESSFLNDPEISSLKNQLLKVSVTRSLVKFYHSIPSRIFNFLNKIR